MKEQNDKSEMVGLDTNVLLRFILQDDPARSKMATHYINVRCTVEKPGYVNHIVLCELIWSLARYNYGRPLIALTLETLLSAERLYVEESALVRQALLLYRDKNMDFPDALLCLLNRKAGCRVTLTFDKKAARLEGFELVR